MGQTLHRKLPDTDGVSLTLNRRRTVERWLSVIGIMLLVAYIVARIDSFVASRVAVQSFEQTRKHAETVDGTDDPTLNRGVSIQVHESEGDDSGEPGQFAAENGVAQ